MRHIRNKVISDIAGLLATTPINWSRVFTQRILSKRVIDTFLMVYFESEDAEKLGIHPASLYRCTINLRIDAAIRIADYEDLEMAIGDVAEEIQTKLTNAAVIAAAQDVKDIELVNTSVSIEEDQGTFALMSQLWRVQYIITEGLPSLGN